MNMVEVSPNQSDQMDINKQILDQLKLLNSRIEKVEPKVDSHDIDSYYHPDLCTVRFRPHTRSTVICCCHH